MKIKPPPLDASQQDAIRQTAVPAAARAVCLFREPLSEARDVPAVPAALAPDVLAAARSPAERAGAGHLQAAAAADTRRRRDHTAAPLQRHDPSDRDDRRTVAGFDRDGRRALQPDRGGRQADLRDVFDRGLFDELRRTHEVAEPLEDLHVHELPGLSLAEGANRYPVSLGQLRKKVAHLRRSVFVNSAL